MSTTTHSLTPDLRALTQTTVWFNLSEGSDPGLTIKPCDYCSAG